MQLDHSCLWHNDLVPHVHVYLFQGWAIDNQVDTLSTEDRATRPILMAPDTGYLLQASKIASPT